MTGWQRQAAGPRPTPWMTRREQAWRHALQSQLDDHPRPGGRLAFLERGSGDWTAAVGAAGRRDRGPHREARPRGAGAGAGPARRGAPRRPRPGALQRGVPGADRRARAARRPGAGERGAGQACAGRWNARPSGCATSSASCGLRCWSGRPGLGADRRRGPAARRDRASRWTWTSPAPEDELDLAALHRGPARRPGGAAERRASTPGAEHVRVATRHRAPDADGASPAGGSWRSRTTAAGSPWTRSPEQAARRHFGLRFMRERAQLVGGQLEIVSEAAAGTTVRLRLDPRERSRTVMVMGYTGPDRRRGWPGPAQPGPEGQDPAGRRPRPVPAGHAPDPRAGAGLRHRRRGGRLRGPRSTPREQHDPDIVLLDLSIAGTRWHRDHPAHQARGAQRGHHRPRRRPRTRTCCSTPSRRARRRSSSRTSGPRTW